MKPRRTIRQLGCLILSTISAAKLTAMAQSPANSSNDDPTKPSELERLPALSPKLELLPPGRRSIGIIIQQRGPRAWVVNTIGIVINDR